MWSLRGLLTLVLPLACTTVVEAAVAPRAKPSHANHASLSQQFTNGGSLLGSLNSPTLPKFLNGPHPGGSEYPWGGRTAQNTNPYYLPNVPNTGVTRYYSWTITNTTLAPDGVELPMLVANGAFPGPEIEANWGDWIEVAVTNGLDEGTSIHWHGFLQTGTPYMDGTPGISQCPIAPGKTFTYRFRAELYGTSWWHSHWSAQYVNGLSGPIVIHGPASDNDYDIDIGPVMLSDWFHNYYDNLILDIFYASATGPQFPPMADNMLINGKNNYPCNATRAGQTCTPNAGLASFKFETGKKHRLRLINHAAEALQFFSIDGYEMTVIANDFVPVVPYQTDLVVMGVGQRTDIIVTGKDDPQGSVYMRVSEGPSGLGPAGDTGCSLNTGVSIEAVAPIYYQDADTSILPNTTSDIAPSRLLFPTNCGNVPLNNTVPSYVMPVKEPDITIPILMTGYPNATGAFVWWMNNVTLEIDYNDVVLLDAKLGQDNFTSRRQVYNMGNHTVLRMVMTSVGFPASHPMHIHGHNMQILAEGVGSWDGSTIVNPQNPQRRDTQIIRPNGYLVVQFELDNPGVWAFHCHVAWHISEGMGINILEVPASIEKELEIPYVMAETCRDWSAYTGNHVVDQIDSGL